MNKVETRRPTNLLPVAVSCLALAVCSAPQAHAASYTINGITVSSTGAGFSQQSANTVYLPADTAPTTFTFANGGGFSLTTSEYGSNQSATTNIAGLPSSGDINVIAGYGYRATITIKDALSNSLLISGTYRLLVSPNTWFKPALNFSYSGNTLSVYGIGNVQQINPDGTVAYLTAGTPVLLGTFSLGPPAPSGPSALDTQAALQLTANKLRTLFNTSTVTTNFANMNTYECNLFDKHGVCVSVGGRYTSVSRPSSETSGGVLVLGYKATPHVRVGAFVDQRINQNMPTGIHLHNRVPLMGAFGVWNQNANGLGLQVKIANAYQSDRMDITRDVIGTSEAGKGSPVLNTESYVGELSYAFNYGNKTLLQPYLAVRYSNLHLDGYTETGVTTPLTYASVNDRTTSALAGLKLHYHLAPRVTLTGSIGVEHDLDHQPGNYSASGISGLTSVNLNSDVNATRPLASAGVNYAISKTRRLSAEISYQELPFQRAGSTTAYINYMIGF